MILIEGPDGAGKTTLAGQLAKEMGLMVSHSPGPKGARERTYDALGTAVKGNDPVRIHDRLYYSEIVYGSVLRGRVEFSDRERRYVESLLHGALNVPTIFCLPPREVVVENVLKTGDTQVAGDLKVLPYIEEIYAWYEEIARRQSWLENAKILTYNYLDPDQSRDGIWEMIHQYLVRRKERTW